MRSLHLTLPVLPAISGLLLVGCASSIASHAGPEEILASNVAMLSSGIRLNNITVFAHEEASKPPAKLKTSSRHSVGFASVFLNVENLKQADTSLVIKQIQIQTVADGKVQMAIQPQEKISLSSFQNDEYVYHLSNQAGYPDQHRVKAVVVYHIGDQTETVESDPIEIQRY
jgi:uncharacterized protein YcfL